MRLRGGHVLAYDDNRRYVHVLEGNSEASPACSFLGERLLELYVFGGNGTECSSRLSGCILL